MLIGALAVLVTGQISILNAVAAINTDVMLFLFGMFIVGEALTKSGYLSVFSHRFLSHARTPGHLIFFILFGAGFLSALLMNDTLAIIMTPLVLMLAKEFRISPELMLLSLAIAVTTGSVMSPIGNPQNLLIAVNSGIATPFVTFGRYLFIPTLICMGLSWFVLKKFYPRDFACRTLEHKQNPIFHTRSVFAVQCALAVILFLVVINIITSIHGGTIMIPLPLIAISAAVPVMLGTKDRTGLLLSLDWHTLVFFAAMFVLMASVWETGFFRLFLDEEKIRSVPMILGTSVFLSQFISNVPFVALVQPMILKAGGTTVELMALAAGSTIAGNLTILGAASNVIIIQNAEKQGHTLSFFEFARVGVPVTIIQMIVYGVFLMLPV